MTFDGLIPRFDELKFFIDFLLLYAVPTELFVVFSSVLVALVLYLISDLLRFFYEGGFFVIVDFLISVVFCGGFVSLVVFSFYFEALAFSFYFEAVFNGCLDSTWGFVSDFCIIDSIFGCSIFNG